MIRILDIFFSLISLVVLSPIIFLIMILCWLDTQSPIFYQKRVGYNKKTFLLFKFRTMNLNALSVGTHLVDKSLITLLGQILRKTKLDELPQLWNVIVGEMSLVGPRPGLPNQKELTKARQRLGVYKVKPGITGLAQIKKIDMSTPTKLAEIDLYMIKTMSFKNYFKYLFLTLKGNGQGDQVKITL